MINKIPVTQINWRVIIPLIILLVLPLPGVCAMRMTLAVGDVNHSLFNASGINLAVSLLPSGFALDGSVAKLSWPGAKAPLKNVQIKCNNLQWQANQWRCNSAQLQVKSSQFGPLTAPFSFVYHQKLQRLDLSGHLDLARHSAALASFGPQFDLAGKLEYALNLHHQTNGTTRLTGRIAVIEANASEANGEIGCENLSMVIKPDITITPEDVLVSGTVKVAKGGVIYAITETTTVAIDTLTAPINFRMSANYQLATTQLNINDVTFDHSPIVALSLKTHLYPLKPFTLDSVKSATINLSNLDIAPFLATYALPGLDPGNWQIAGQMQGHLDHNHTKDTSLTLQLANVSLSEKFFERLTVEGLDGIVNISRHKPETSRLGWKSLALKKLVTGASRFSIHTHGSEVKIPSLKLPFKQGALELKNIDCVNCLDQKRKISAAARMVATPLSVFASIVGEGMPAILGEVNVAMPSLTYQNDRVELAGQVVVDVFDGKIIADDLSFDGITGRVPRMGGAIKLDKIDLEELTQTINFGKITGSLSGYVRDMELINWVPIAFDASLYSTPNDKVRKRISQKAVDALTEIGGAGGALAQSYLRFFEEFSYSNLGISCRLEGDVCHLGGIDESANGFYILKGSGLPYISIMGDRAETSWSELMDKIRVIVSSQSNDSADAHRE